jgi:hypothetical protein
VSGPVSRPDGLEAAPAPPAPADAATETAVTVLAPYQVSHAGKVYVSGDTVTVPAATARAWQVNGWAVPGE